VKPVWQTLLNAERFHSYTVALARLECSMLHAESA
jgi:hypothetical protein